MPCTLRHQPWSAAYQGAGPPRIRQRAPIRHHDRKRMESVSNYSLYEQKLEPEPECSWRGS